MSCVWPTAVLCSYTALVVWDKERLLLRRETATGATGFVELDLRFIRPEPTVPTVPYSDCVVLALFSP